jgi:glycerol kinase
MQFQADVLGIPVDRPVVRDTTVQGIALAAGLAVGFWDNYETLVSRRQIDRVFEPSEQATPALENFVTWQKALTRAKHWSEE